MSESTRTLPERPDLNWYRKLAKKRLRELRARSGSAKLADAQLAVAREHGFASWRKLSAAIGEQRQVNLPHLFRDLMKAIVARDDATAAELIRQAPEVVRLTGPHPVWGGRPQPLHVSIEFNAPGIFEQLLAAGAEPAGRNYEYGFWSPVMLAVHWKRDAMRDALRGRIDRLSLFDALMLGDDVSVASILANDPTSLTHNVPNNGTALHLARSAACAKRLVAMGVSIDATDKYNRTALDTAAAAGARDVVHLLASHGGHASAATFARLGDLDRLKQAMTRQDLDGPLLVAAIHSRNPKLVKWLIGLGADVNEPNTTGATPLHHAAFDGVLPIVKMLVNAGANVHAEDDEYNATPAGWAQHAAQNVNRPACAEIAAYLEEQMKKKPITSPSTRKSTEDPTHWKPIMDASFVGDAKRVESLIKSGADPNIASKTTGGHRPLHRAIEDKKTAPRTEKHLDTVRVLLSHGADPMLRGSWEKHTALALASMDDPRFVPILLEHVKALDIFHACCVLDEKRVTALLKKDAMLASARDENRFSPLHYLAASTLFGLSEKHLQTQLSIARRLIDASGDVKSTYNYANGQWPISVLYFACGRHNNPRLTELLINAGADPCDNESVYHAADEGHEECLAIIERLTPKKKLAKEASMSLATQMHWGKSRGAKWLLEHGADPNVYHTQSGNSALHSAAIHGANPKMIDLLLAHGADPSLKNRDKKDAIQLAREAKKDRVLKQLRAGIIRS